MTTLPLNFNTFAAAVLTWHVHDSLMQPEKFLETLDNDLEGDIQGLALCDLDNAYHSNEYDEVLELFFDTTEEMTNDDYELIGRWIKDDQLLEMLTQRYKAIENSARLLARNKTDKG